MNITPTRLKVLRFLSDKPGGYNAKRVTQECCPREGCGGRPLHYTEQGLARMTGKVMKPLREAGLIVPADWRAPMHSLQVLLTPAGRALLVEQEKAASARELAAAIDSGA